MALSRPISKYYCLNKLIYKNAIVIETFNVQLQLSDDFAFI